jgi:hypothetical protein
MESEIGNYFSTIAIPDGPCLYDHLLVSLRSKDIVATFNWDPLLVDARNRNPFIAGPMLLFLHGNVRIAICLEHRVKGVVGQLCPKCRRKMTPSRLLYPVRKKDYASDAFIASQWAALRWALKNAFALTIFGYGAPTTDIDAIAIMKEAWGDVNVRQFEQTELIDIRPENEVRDLWAAFIHTHHYQHHTDFYESLIPNHPRRTCEALKAQCYEAKFTDTNPLPQGVSQTALWDWLEPLLSAESKLEDTA